MGTKGGFHFVENIFCVTKHYVIRLRASTALAGLSGAVADSGRGRGPPAPPHQRCCLVPHRPAAPRPVGSRCRGQSRFLWTGRSAVRAEADAVSAHRGVGLPAVMTIVLDVPSWERPVGPPRSRPRPDQSPDRHAVRSRGHILLPAWPGQLTRPCDALRPAQQDEDQYEGEQKI